MSKITELLRKAYRENNRKKRSIDTDNFEIRKDNRKQFVYEKKGQNYPYESHINRREAKEILSNAGINKKELDKLIRTNETGGRGSKSTRWKKGKDGQYFYARDNEETIKNTKRGRANERAIKRYKELEEDIPF